MTHREWRAGRLMIRMEPEAPGRTARVIGSLTGDAVEVLLQAVDGGVTVLDLSEVDKADEAAVQVLAGLAPGRCSLLACPRWLQMWLDSVHRSTGPAQGRAEEGGPGRREGRVDAAILAVAGLRPSGADEV
jgi:hypothetical protein